MTAQFSATELARRVSVWAALADLFLDTDVTLFYRSIADAVVKSGYHPDELLRILRYEVGPVFFRNMLSTAGEWASWRAEDVEDAILRHLGLPAPIRYVLRLLSKPVVEWTVREHWPRIRAMIGAAP